MNNTVYNASDDVKWKRRFVEPPQPTITTTTPVVKDHYRPAFISRVQDLEHSFLCPPVEYLSWWFVTKVRKFTTTFRIWALRHSVTLHCSSWSAIDTAMQLHSRGIVLVYVFSVLLFLIGATLLSVLPGIIRNGVFEAVLLKNDSNAARLWENPPYDMKMEIWIFNVTNANDIIYYGAKPVLTELGPYTFHQYQKKIDVQFYDNGTISYKNFKWYHFNASLSCPRCRLTDEVYVPSVPFWTLVHKLRHMGGLPKMKKFISFGLLGLGEHPLVSHTVDELLFSGYKDVLFSMAKTLHWLSPDTELPERMGFLYGKNGTADGPFLIKSGVEDFNEKGRIELYKWKASVDCWSRSTCNTINGSDGTVFPPFLEKSARLQIFAPDLYRSLYLEFLMDHKVDQFLAYRYTVPQSVFNDTLEENAGYCWPTDVYYRSSQAVEPSTGLACLPSGLLNISKCQMGAPIVLSSPHFLYSNSEVQNSVLGLRPNIRNHATSIDFEPITGTGLVFDRKLQINVALVHDDDFSTIKRLQSVIMPVLWIKESAHLNDEKRDDLWGRLFLPKMIASGAGFSLVGFGSVALIVAIVLHIHHRRQSKEETI